MKRMPEIFYGDDSLNCGCCFHGINYIPYLSSSRYAATVKCKKHNCRVYALGGRCKDFDGSWNHHRSAKKRFSLG